MQCVDGFSVTEDHPDLEIHRRIDMDLQSLRQLRGAPATFEMMLPAFSKVEYAKRHEWIEALLERVEWNATQNNQHWLDHLSMLVQQAIGHHRKPGLSEAALLRMVKFGHELHSNFGSLMFHNLPDVLQQVFARRGRREPLPPDVVRALPRLIDHLTRIHSHSSATYAVAWRYFLDESASGFGGCFSDRVKQDWMAMPAAEHAAWGRLFALADHNWQAEQLARGKADKIAKALAEVGLEPVARRITDWIPDPARNPAEMSAIGMTLLRQILLWGVAQPALAIDDSLLRLAAVEWAEPAAGMLVKEWLGTFLQCLACRERIQTFACAERMLQNPHFSEYMAVRDLYEAQLAEATPVAVGVDGFPLTCPLQVVLDGVLRSCVPAHVVAGVDPSELDNLAFLQLQKGNISGSRGVARQAAIRQAGGQLTPLLRALHARTQWLIEHWPRANAYEEAGTPWLFWRCEAGYFYIDLLSQKISLELTDLITLCEVDRQGFFGVSPSQSIFHHCKARISLHGYEPALVAAMRMWVKSLHGTIAAMNLRKAVEWLLWFDTGSKVDVKQCWSSCIQADLRNSSVATAWIELLENRSLGTSGKPGRQWLKQAVGLFANVGAGEFRNRIQDWFAPFRDGQPMRLTVTGRDLLRNLVWYGAYIAKDPQVDRAISWFATAKWKTKADAGCMVAILPSFVMAVIERMPDNAAEVLGPLEPVLQGKTHDLYREHCAGRAGRVIAPYVPQPMPDPEVLKRRMMESAITQFGGKVVGNEIWIQGPTDRYRIEISAEAPIVRESDGKRVWVRQAEEGPFGFRKVARSNFQRMMDLADLQNPFAPNFATLSLYTMVLAGGVEDLYRIVEHPES
jgi:hypothetical protein